MHVRAWSHAFAILCCCALPVLFDTGDAAALEPGDAAPGFRLLDLAGERFVESDSLVAPHRGPLLLVFWDMACPDCLGDVAATAERLRAGSDCGPRVVGICTESDRIGDARRFAHGMKLGFLNLWDARGSAASAYDAGDDSYAAVLVSGTDGTMTGDPTIALAHYGHAEAIDSLLETIWARACEIATPPSDTTTDEP